MAKCSAGSVGGSGGAGDPLGPPRPRGCQGASPWPQEGEGLASGAGSFAWGRLNTTLAVGRVQVLSRP